MNLCFDWGLVPAVYFQEVKQINSFWKENLILLSKKN